MIDHVKLYVADVPTSVAFYERALEPIGYRAMMDLGALGVAFGRERPEFWVAPRAGGGPAAAHVAFRADRRAAVDAFHAAALLAGGRDNGAPGPRAHYHPHYYGAFVLDPDANNVEAVCHASGA